MNREDIGGDMGKQILVRPEECCLHIIDPQKSLMDQIYEADRVTRIIELMARSADALQIPIVSNTQYKKGLGPYVQPLQDLAAELAFPCRDKVEFSAYRNEETLSMVDGVAGDVSTVILVGVETHICIYQSAATLLERGITPWVVADGVSARSPESHTLGLARLTSMGAVVGPAEMIIYELIGKAGTPAFKAILPHIIEFGKK